MNQILTTERKAKKSSGPVEINKIVLFFCVAILIFGIAMVGQGVYAIVKDAGQAQKPGITNPNKGTIPNVSVEREENYIVITISHDKAIDEITYNWNGGADEKIEANGKSQLIESIELPTGNNTLNLKVTDIDAVEATFQKSYVVSGEDTTKPEITLKASGNSMTITAKDNVEMAFITYRWNNEEEKKVEVDATNPTQITTQIEIPLGENVLTINAVDKSNNMEMKEQKVKGLTRPEINVYQDPDNMKYLVITVTDEVAVKVVDFVLNGKSYRLDFGEQKTYQYWQEMIPGTNSISIKAYNTQGASKEFTGNCTYNP